MWKSWLIHVKGWHSRWRVQPLLTCFRFPRRVALLYILITWCYPLPLLCHILWNIVPNQSIITWSHVNIQRTDFKMLWKPKRASAHRILQANWLSWSPKLLCSLVWAFLYEVTILQWMVFLDQLYRRTLKPGQCEGSVGLKIVLNPLNHKLCRHSGWSIFTFSFSNPELRGCY